QLSSPLSVAAFVCPDCVPQSTRSSSCAPPPIITLPPLLRLQRSPVQPFCPQCCDRPVVGPLSLGSASVKGCAMPALTRGHASTQLRLAGRRHTSHKGGNRGA